MPMIRHSLQRWFAILIWLVISLPLGASTGSPWFFRAWQTEDGLPEHTLVGLEQTPDGYLWVATHRSLSRFDGMRFQEFSHATLTERATDQIRAMLLDRRGRLWLAKDGGAVLCVEAGAVTQSFTLGETSGGAPARAMTEDARGNLWISDSAGAVFRIQEGRVQRFGTAEGLPGQGICWMATDTQGRFWFSQAGSVGIFRDGGFETFLKLDPPTARIAPARQGGVWICGGSKLFHFRAGGKLEALAEINPKTGGGGLAVTALYEDKARGLWIGTSSSGLFRFDSQGLKSVDTSHPNIIHVGEDSEGNLWVGTRGGGLNRLSPRAVQLVSPADGLPFAAVQSACEDAAGDLWAAGQNGLLARRTQGQWTLFSSDSGWTAGGVICVAADASGGVLIGTRDNGIFRPEQEGFAPLPLNSQLANLTNLTIRSLYPSANGDLWVAINGGVVRFRARDGRGKHFSLPAGTSDIRAIAQDASGDVWLGTTSDGMLFRVHDEVLRNETTNVMHGSQHIRCLQVTGDGSLWLGYAGQGLGRFKNGRYFQFHKSHGLWDEFVSQIQVDDRGRLWIAGNRGIFHTTLSELGAVAEGRIPSLRSVAFGRGEGVPNLQAAFGICPTVTQTREGRLLMPMLTGLAIVEPRVLRKNPARPPVILERLTVNGRLVAAYDLPGQRDSTNEPAPVNFRDLSLPLRIGAGVEELKFEFTALNLAAPENVTFRYQLERVDQEPVEAGAGRSARYPNVAPGKFRFHVAACNHDGVWNDDGASVVLIIAPQLWEAAWFRVVASAACAGLLVGSVVLAVRRRFWRKLERLEQQRALERERTRIAQDLHDDLGAGLVEINFGSELAQDPALRPEEVREHTREIGTRAREMVTALDEIVWAVNPKHDDVSSLVTYFCQFAQHFLKATPGGTGEAAAARRSPVQCQLDVARDLPAAPLNAEQRHSLFLAFKEALSNVVQHAGATELRLTIAVGDGQLVISVRDNGRGFDPAAPRERRTADGLGNMQRRLQQLGGRCEFASRPGEGTTVSFHVPLATRRGGAVA